MSTQSPRRSFWFTGNAVAVGGQLRSPVVETLDAQGSAVLPAVGGFASATVGSFNHRNIVAFERATSTVAGRRVEGPEGTTFDTHVAVVVEGLNVLDVVTADRIVARLASSHREDDLEPPMLPFGSFFDNLRIGGVPVEAHLDGTLAVSGRYGEVLRACGPRCVDAAGQPLALAETGALRATPWQHGGASPSYEDRLALTPLFDLAGATDGPLARVGGVGPTSIHVAGFGTVFLGEYLVSRYARRLTMVRIELGSPVEGTVTAGDVSINGHIYP